MNENPAQETAPVAQEAPPPEPTQADAAETSTEAPAAVAEGSPEPAAEGTEPSAETPAGGAAEPATSAEVDIGNVVEGTVQRITPYGAFVQLAGGKVGLIHISEIDRNYVKDVHEFLRESDVVKAKVLTIKEDGKIDLSIKAMQDPQPRLQRKRGSDPEFEQKLKRFMRQSEERQVDYKRSVEHKRK
ncbi:MAG: S1 RNA-binding domain-containing protein [Actinomycetota bacterium]